MNTSHRLAYSYNISPLLFFLPGGPPGGVLGRPQEMSAYPHVPPTFQLYLKVTVIPKSIPVALPHPPLGDRVLHHHLLPDLQPWQVPSPLVIHLLQPSLLSLCWSWPGPKFFHVGRQASA